MESKLWGVQTYFAKLLLDQLHGLIMRHRLLLQMDFLLVFNTRRNNREPWEWFPTCKNFLTIPTSYKNPRSFTEMIILSLLQEKCYMGISEMKTVHWQMVQVIPSKETPKNPGKTRVRSLTTFLARAEESGYLCFAGLARIHLAASTTGFTTRYSLGSW